MEQTMKVSFQQSEDGDYLLSIGCITSRDRKEKYLQYMFRGNHHSELTHLLNCQPIECR